MKAQLEIITPAAAKDLLDRNPLNRRLSPKTIARYAADMKADRWNNNGQGIIISIEGDLLDGQHRLMAILAAQKSVGMLVVRGVDRESFTTMDSGKPRSLADVLSIQGGVHSNTIATAARYAYNYVANVQQNYMPTKATLFDFIGDNKYLAEAATLVGAKNLHISQSVLTAIIFLGNSRRLLNDEAKDFIEGIVSGEGLRRGDPRHTLREWAIAERSRHRVYIKAETLFAATGRAWNAFASGKELSVLKGLAKPTLLSMPIFGFERASFPHVDGLAAKVVETRLGNLGQTKSMPRRTVERARPVFAAAG